MPENPNTWTDVLNRLSPEIAGILMAMFIAVLRVIYDRQETKPMRIVLEACICGALSLTASSAILALGLNQNWAIFAGGAIGYFGSATIRTLAMKIIKSRLRKDDD